MTISGVQKLMVPQKVTQVVTEVITW